MLTKVSKELSIQILSNKYLENVERKLKECVVDWLQETRHLEFFDQFTKIEHTRSQLYHSGSLGGPATDTNALLAKEAVTWSRSAFWSSLLFYLVKKMGRRNCIELGTCVGISSAYQGLALKELTGSKLVSIEANAELANVAQDVILSLDLSDKVTIVNSNFQSCLENILIQNEAIDFCFIDGDHIGDYTINYHNLLKKHANHSAIFIYDDIRWSSDMKKAWKYICNDPDVSFSIDLHYQGICVVSPGNIKKTHVYAPLFHP